MREFAPLVKPNSMDGVEGVTYLVAYHVFGTAGCRFERASDTHTTCMAAFLDASACMCVCANVCNNCINVCGHVCNDAYLRFAVCVSALVSRDPNKICMVLWRIMGRAVDTETFKFD